MWGPRLDLLPGLLSTAGMTQSTGSVVAPSQHVTEKGGKGKGWKAREGKRRERKGTERNVRERKGRNEFLEDF